MADPEHFVLYGHFESGNCYKVALMLSLLEQPFEYRHVALFDGETRTEEFRKLNRFQEVPVLQHGEVTLCQSGVILTYLADRSGRLGGRDDAERRTIAEWLAWEGHRLLAGPALLRYVHRFQPQSDPAVRAFLKPRAEYALDQFERAVADGFLVNGRPTIADVACCGYMFKLDQTGLDPARWPGIGAWIDRIRALPGFKASDAALPRG